MIDFGFWNQFGLCKRSEGRKRDSYKSSPADEKGWWKAAIGNDKPLLYHSLSQYVIIHVWYHDCGNFIISTYIDYSRSHTLDCIETPMSEGCISESHIMFCVSSLPPYILISSVHPPLLHFLTRQELPNKGGLVHTPRIKSQPSVPAASLCKPWFATWSYQSKDQRCISLSCILDCTYAHEHDGL